MNFFDTIQLATILGQDMRFWMTVMVASALKWFFTPVRQTSRQAIAGIVAGAATAYYGHDWIIRSFDTLTVADKDIVIIGLVISGEHLVRTMMIYLPNLINKKLGMDEKERE
jgi:hypothetical protein